LFVKTKVIEKLTKINLLYMLMKQKTNIQNKNQLSIKGIRAFFIYRL